MRTRPLSPDEAALWARVMAGVRPIAGRASVPVEATIAQPKPLASSPAAGWVAGQPKDSTRTEASLQPSTKPSPKPLANTLDGTWDRQLARGLVAPDRTVDLHGHTLGSAYDVLDAALDAAIRAGDRIILLVTGKPPRPASERPHARGAIRAATGDWLTRSRHAAAIAAVRGAHPRHGGTGALYIVLKRPRPAAGISRKF